MSLRKTVRAGIIAVAVAASMAASLAQAAAPSLGGTAKPIASTGTPAPGDTLTLTLNVINNSTADTGAPMDVNILSSATFGPPEAQMTLAVQPNTNIELPGTLTFVPTGGNGCLSNAACVTGCSSAGTCVAGFCSGAPTIACSTLNDICPNRVIVGVSGCSIAAAGMVNLATVNVQFQSQPPFPNAFVTLGSTDLKGTSGTCVATKCTNAPNFTCSTNANCNFSTLPGQATGSTTLMPVFCGNDVVDTGETCDTGVPGGKVPTLPDECPTCPAEITTKCRA